MVSQIAAVRYQLAGVNRRYVKIPAYLFRCDRINIDRVRADWGSDGDKRFAVVHKRQSESNEKCRKDKQYPLDQPSIAG